MLNLEITDEAYLCGRLFAVLEKIQYKSNNLNKNIDEKNELNAGVKDKFFASACATPYLVFPRLVKLAQNHLSKLKKEKKDVFYEKILLEIMGKMENSFPRTMNMEAQGVFILGYYQQKDSFFQKKVETTESEEN